MIRLDIIEKSEMIFMIKHSLMRFSINDMQFSLGTKDYWQNGETTWDQGVSEKSINVFWLVLRHQLQKSLWKWHYWFSYFFLWWAFVITFDYNSNLLLSLCAFCWTERRNLLKTYKSVNTLFFCICIYMFLCFFAHSHIVGL